ncbi:MAG TPA: tol-pal system protein YbgF [Rhizomicrobium sp.]|nr:tol-pal system protein YbgF [Rhizomicrobium sp.]
MTKQRLLVSVLACGMALAPISANAQLFGPSDEEKAREAAQDSGIEALQGTTQQQDGRIKELEDRVRALTDSLSRATGTNEELSHQLQQQNDKIDKMEKDFAYRLCTLSSQQLSAGDSINCAAAGTISATGAQAYAPPPGAMRPGDSLPPIGSAAPAAPDGAANNPVAAGEPAVLGRPPGVLGTLPMGSGPATASAVPPPSAPQGGGAAQYDQAMNLMSRAQYTEASAAFRAYADANPGDTDLAPQAVYWVGNISFIRQDYAGAQRAFAEVIKKYPKSQRAPDAMLKLAQSFMSLGQKPEGCTTLALVKSRYPNAPAQTLASAASLRKTACGK